MYLSQLELQRIFERAAARATLAFSSGFHPAPLLALLGPAQGVGSVCEWMDFSCANISMSRICPPCSGPSSPQGMRVIKVEELASSAQGAHCQQGTFLPELCSTGGCQSLRGAVAGFLEAAGSRRS